MYANAKAIFLLGFLLATSGCKAALGVSITARLGRHCESGSTQRSQLEFGSGAPRKLNVIFVVDTSGSMSDEAGRLSQSLPKFLSDLQAELGDSAKVIVQGVERAAPLSVPSGVYQHSYAVGSRDKIARIAEGLGLSGGVQISAAQRFSGPDTIHHYVVITDDIEQIGQCDPTKMLHPMPGAFTPEEDAEWLAYQSCLVSHFKANVIQPLHSRGEAVRLSALYSHSVGGADKDYAWRAALSGKGYPYEGLASTFGGRVYDLDQPDWTQILGDLKNLLVEDARGLAIEACRDSQIELVSATLEQGGVSKSVAIHDQVTLSRASGESSPRISVNRTAIEALGFDPGAPFNLAVVTRVK